MPGHACYMGIGGVESAASGVEWEVRRRHRWREQSVWWGSASQQLCSFGGRVSAWDDAREVSPWRVDDSATQL